MKVLHVFNQLKFSGAEIMYVDAASFFIEKGCELTALATGDELGEFSQNFKNQGYRLVHKKMPVLSNVRARISYYKEIVNFLKEEKYDVVHIHSAAARWGFALCSKLANTKSIYTFHNVFSSGKFTYIYHYLLRYSAKYFFGCKFHTISDSVYDNELNYYHNKTYKVYNWYGNNRFFPAMGEEKKANRKKLGIPEDSLVLISIGGCSEVKQHSEIIKALQKITSVNPNTYYFHLGEGHVLNEEVKLVKDLNLENNVKFYGNQSDVRSYLIASDIYLMTSKFEGISLTTIEAMACKIPAILYNVPGLKDFNKNGMKNCELIPEDINVLAKTAISLYRDKEKIKLLVDNAESYVKETYFLPTNAKGIYDLYTL